MLPVEKKSTVLNRVYAVYDQFVAHQNVACEKFCSDCCTCNVTMTSLEAYQIVVHKGMHVLHAAPRLESVAARKRFQPRITTNRLAELCMRGGDVPPEASDPNWGRCPFLCDDACLIYPVRPFGCRCLISSQKCRPSGCAEVTPLVLTANTVFMQTIEHLDHGGVSGNLTDILQWLSVDDHRRQYEAGVIDPPAQKELIISNRPMPCLMVPPEHRREIMPLFEALQQIDPGGC